jgi:CubicO group peptidase (beta-lactamase class C family)
MSETSMNGQRLELLETVIRADIAAGLYHGMVLRVSRGGRVVFDKALGSADAAQSKPLQSNSVFSIFSVTKAFTNLLTLRAIEEGRYALTTRVSDVIPDFKGNGREAVTFFHLLSHQSGFPIIFELKT